MFKDSSDRCSRASAFVGVHRVQNLDDAVWFAAQIHVKDALSGAIRALPGFGKHESDGVNAVGDRDLQEEILVARESLGFEDVLVGGLGVDLALEAHLGVGLGVGEG